MSTVKSDLWPLPALGIVLAVAMAVGLSRLDRALDDDLPAALASYLFGGGASAARQVLGVIAGSLITVTSLTFSLTVVTLQLASSQFSPRLLRTFTGDRFVQVTLALFLTTFVYALTVLRTVRTPSEGGSFVPRIAITVGYVLTLASVAALVAFLSHLVRQIRVETMVRNVHTEASRTIDRMLPDADAPEQSARTLVPPPSALLVACQTSGFLTHVDHGRLLAAMVEADACLVVERPVGTSLVAGTPVGRAWLRGGGDPEPGQRDQLLRSIHLTLTTTYERTADQDTAFGLRQLTDVAARALSPGINDPTTAIHTLSHSSALLCGLARRDVPATRLCDENGTLRVVVMREDLPELLDLAIAQPRRFGADDPAVLNRLYTLLREVAWVASRREHHEAVAAQVERLDRTVAGQDFDDAERRMLQAHSDAVREATHGRWPPPD